MTATRTCLLVFALFASTAHAQLDWWRDTTLHGLWNPALGYDEAQGRVLMFGGIRPGLHLPADETWEWVDSAWRL